MSHFTEGTAGNRRDLPLETGLTSAAAAVAYAGALPLIGAVIFAWAQPDASEAILRLMALYGITLLAFFGGVRWGIAVMMRHGPTFRQLLGAIVPVIIAITAHFVEETTARLILLVVVIPILLLDDLRATRRGSGAPAWYLGVRLPLTIMMELAFIAALALSLIAG